MTLLSHRFRPILRDELPRVVPLVLLTLIGVGLDALAPWPLKLILDHVLDRQPLPPVLGWLGATTASPHALLAWLAAAVVLVFALQQIAALLRNTLQAASAARLQYATAAEVFGRLQTLPLAFHRRARRGDLVRRVNVDSGAVASLLTGVLLPVVGSVVSLIVMFAIMWQLDATLALLAGLVALPMALTMKLLAPRMSERADEQQRVEGQVWSATEQTLMAIPLVQAFGREHHEHERFMHVANRSARAYLRTIAAQLQFKIGIDGSQALGLAVLMVIGGLHVLRGDLSTGSLVVFLSYLAALYAPLISFAYLAQTFAHAGASARRVEEILSAPDALAERPDALPLTITRSGRRGHVRLDHIVFGYEKDRPVLRDIEFEAKPGETVAIVGRSGAGKTTLAMLIPRLMDPWQGRVLIDGVDVRDASVDSVRASVALVLQDAFLSPITIAENIAYGRPAATRAEIEAAARAANAEEFIVRMPQGYDTIIGERGATLSGGQRQRIAIARALLVDAPIIIMDEPTSALDTATEDLVLSALSRLTRDRTTIIIAHRLSTVRRASRIVLLDEGEIAAQGSHDEMLAMSPLYRMLYHGAGKVEATDILH